MTTFHILTTRGELFLLDLPGENYLPQALALGELPGKRFLRCRDLGGVTAYVNLDHILQIRPIPAAKQGAGTTHE